MLRCNKLYYNIICVLVISVWSHAEADEFSFVENSFAYKGHVIDTAFNVTINNFRTEGGVLANIVDSEFNDLKVIKIISEKGVLEVWLYNEASKDKLLRIDTYPTDYRVFWVSSQYLEVSRSHMGTSVSYLYEVGLPLMLVRKSDSIDKMIYFDSKSECFVRYVFPSSERPNDTIIVGKLFSDFEESFVVDLEYKYLSDAFGMIQGARVEEGLLYITIKRGENKIITNQYKLKCSSCWSRPSIQR